VFVNNVAITGGAIWNDLGTPVITGSTFIGNESGSGGAVYNLSIASSTSDPSW
jgi:hypothetical protein